MEKKREYIITPKEFGRRLLKWQNIEMGGGGYIIPKPPYYWKQILSPSSFYFTFFPSVSPAVKSFFFFHNSPKSTLNSLSLRILCSRANHVERHWRRALSPFHGFYRQAAAGFLPASLQSYEELTAQIKEGKVLALT
ncbi:hypothetical protein [Neomoorella humiferrea]|uniref:hypothetical protein n=1 Tax=Neomoorella humiferrea TaxID=676965 RepID=UPI000D02DD67|nr:hypothetical protein [Moorella humiferrea]